MCFVLSLSFFFLKIQLSGTIIMGHPNPGLKHSRHTQNKIRHLGRILPKLGHPKPLQTREAQVHTRPTAQHRGTVHPKRPRTRRTISASLEASPPRSPVARPISASLEGRRPTLGKQANSASLKTPLSRALCGASARGETQPRSRPPSTDETSNPSAHPPD